MEYNCVVRGGYSMLTQRQIAQTHRLLADRTGLEEIASCLGMSMSTFRYHLRESGYRIKSDTVRSLEPLVPVALNPHDADEQLLAA